MEREMELFRRQEILEKLRREEEERKERKRREEEERIEKARRMAEQQREVSEERSKIRLEEELTGRG